MKGGMGHGVGANDLPVKSSIGPVANGCCMAWTDGLCASVTQSWWLLPPAE